LKELNQKPVWELEKKEDGSAPTPTNKISPADLSSSLEFVALGEREQSSFAVNFKSRILSPLCSALV